ncbi:hypothetical protein QNN00_23430 [Bacillus velezensis]|nr:hypothetical protein [Bacillus velezensis]
MFLWRLPSSCQPAPAQNPQAPNPNRQENRKRRRFGCRVNREPTLFNPLYSTDVASSDIEGMLYSTLLETDEKLNVKPSLAEKVTEADGD